MNALKLLAAAASEDPRLADVVPGMDEGMSDGEVLDKLAARTDSVLDGASEVALDVVRELRQDTSLTDLQRDLVCYAGDCVDQGIPEVALGILVAMMARRTRTHAGFCETLWAFMDWALSASLVAPDLMPGIVRAHSAFHEACQTFFAARKVSEAIRKAGAEV